MKLDEAENKPAGTCVGDSQSQFTYQQRLGHTESGSMGWFYWLAFYNDCDAMRRAESASLYTSFRSQMEDADLFVARLDVAVFSFADHHSVTLP